MEASSAKGEENEAREDDATVSEDAASEEEPASESADTQADPEPDSEDASDEPESADADEEPKSDSSDSAKDDAQKDSQKNVSSHWDPEKKKKEAEKKKKEENAGYLRLSRLQPSELLGCVAAAVLALSLFLPWFATSATNDESSIAMANGKIAKGGDTVSAWLAFPIMRWFALAMAIAPFGLVWVVARGHKLDWRPGEMTMVIGVAAFVLVLCNGIILGKPGDTVEVSLQWGYPIALVAGIGIAYAGYRRQARSIKNRKPPGTI